MDSRFLRHVLIKGTTLFLLISLLFPLVNPEALGRISLYNHVITGRERFPFGEDSAHAYNLSLFNFEAMFASHVISKGQKPADEYRVVLLGDSSTWGTLLRPNETIAGQLNFGSPVMCNKKVRFYNLGYPTISLTKDLMVLEAGMDFQPDLIVWLISMEAFPDEVQVASPIVANNVPRLEESLETFGLSSVPGFQALVHPTFWDRTLIGQRRALADLFRLQMYGFLWTATGVDQVYPDDYQPAKRDFDTDASFHGMLPPELDESRLSFELLEAGVNNPWEVPVILVNEPILISDGENSDLRYNFLYPRWAYDQWRAAMTSRAELNRWIYIDLWNIVPAEEFTNSAIHLTPAGVAMVAGSLEPIIRSQGCR